MIIVAFLKTVFHYPALIVIDFQYAFLFLPYGPLYFVLVQY